MKASIVDLRYKTNEILKALDQNENVEILYHGKLKGVIHPAKQNNQEKVKNHPFFNMIKADEKSVLDELADLRAPRYDF